MNGPRGCGTRNQKSQPRFKIHGLTALYHLCEEESSSLLHAAILRIQLPHEHIPRAVSLPPAESVFAKLASNGDCEGGG